LCLWRGEGASFNSASAVSRGPASPQRGTRGIARTPEAATRLAVQLGGNGNGAELKVDSLDTGWTSGRLPLQAGLTLELPLAAAGDNVFKVAAFDGGSWPEALKQDRILITRTAATVDSIPASLSIGTEVKDRAGGGTVLDWLVRAADRLPVKGQRGYRAPHRARRSARLP
jgi:molecular chaperone DnaK